MAYNEELSLFHKEMLIAGLICVKLVIKDHQCFSASSCMLNCAHVY